MWRAARGPTRVGEGQSRRGARVLYAALHNNPLALALDPYTDRLQGRAPLFNPQHIVAYVPGRRGKHGADRARSRVGS